jgi:hypothetical protein
MLRATPDNANLSKGTTTQSMSSYKRFPHRRMRRTDLFLVRVWAEETTTTMGADGVDRPVCRGRVQRVVDGESYQFDDWQGLADLLMAMLEGTAPTKAQPPKDQD